MEAQFRLFGDCVNLDARNIHGLRRTYHRLRNHFRMVCLGQTKHLSCTEINSLQMDRYECPLDPRHVRVPSGRSKIISSLLYIRCKLCTYVALTLTLSLNRPKRAPLNPRQQWVPSDAPKMISEPIAHSTQIVYLSCVKISTVSKWTKTSFHFIHVISEYHWVHPKWFLSQWYIRHKPCTDLASRLALSPNGPLRASTWPTSRRTTIGRDQNDFWGYGTFAANRAPILCRH
jgi:hypothetical protein